MDKLLNISELAKKLHKDRATVARKIASSGLKPASTDRYNKYSLSTVRDLFKKSETRSVRQELNDEKLSEQIRKLRLENDIKAGQFVNRAMLEEVMGKTLTQFRSILEQKLTREWPLSAHGLEIDELRELGKKTFSDILELCRGAEVLWHPLEQHNIQQH